MTREFDLQNLCHSIEVAMHSIKCHIKEVGLYLTLMGLSHTT